MLKYENVTFLKAPALKLTKEEFIARHLSVYWTDRKESVRKKMLGNAYDLMAGVAKSKK